MSTINTAGIKYISICIMYVRRLERSSFQSLLADVQSDLVNEMTKREDAKKPAEAEEVDAKYMI
jgi:hypothetical protein